MAMARLIGVLMFIGSVTACFAAGGQEIWTDQCARCHGTDGKAQTPMGKKLKIKDFTDSKVQSDMNDDAMFKSIKDGRQASDGKTLMQPAKNVTDDEIKALIQFVRGLKQ